MQSVLLLLIYLKYGTYEKLLPILLGISLIGSTLLNLNNIKFLVKLKFKYQKTV